MACDGRPVASIAEFKEKYGADAVTFRLVMQEFIYKSPDFPGAVELARELGVMMSDLELALRADNQK